MLRLAFSSPKVKPNAGESSLAYQSMEAKAIRRKIVIHQGRSGLCFMISIISLMLGSAFAIPVRASTEWETWVISWQSNFFLYFAVACFILCLLNGSRAAYLHYHAKRHQRSER